MPESKTARELMLEEIDGQLDDLLRKEREVETQIASIEGARGILSHIRQRIVNGIVRLDKEPS